MQILCHCTFKLLEMSKLTNQNQVF